MMHNHEATAMNETTTTTPIEKMKAAVEAMKAAVARLAGGSR